MIMLSPGFYFVFTVFFTVILRSYQQVLRPGSVCRALPSDAAWPSQSLWDAFNASVDGRLIRTVPIGSPCHDPSFDQAKCAFVRDNWHETSLHLSSSSSMMTPFFANRSCDPFTAPNDQCVVGSYVQYTVNVSSTAHIGKTLAFAKQHNIRFVVRNTGHDYMGKSTGTGGLAVWTHYLRDTRWIDNFVSSSYRGTAVQAHAGVSASQMYKEADERGHVIVGSDCRSVGFAGGYIQGGGHSALSSLFGMAADSALEYEVVTTKGDVITASPTKNADLYWALSGGGGGTYGVVWSVTVKAHPSVPITVANITFTSQNISQDVFWKAISAYQATTPSISDAGASALAMYGSASFNLAPLFAPNLTIPQVMKLVNPILSNLTALGISHSFNINTYPSFRTGFDSVPAWVDLQNPDSFNNMIAVLRDIADNGGLVEDLTVSPTVKIPDSPSNAVLPAWRQAQKFVITLIPWNDTATDAEILATRHKITKTLDGPLRRLSPHSGTYLNEADTDEPDWQHSFYGSNYPRLLAIKNKWDPDQLLYGSTAVGGDRWQEDEDGRLCKV